ncbi:MAG: hypothetical protein KatS3mg027_1581 [Bacteroidia bacterium]|nr:MAG: hypothetical protein KatS3mg027_1581 [Bacteroidia bacterium]
MHPKEKFLREEYISILKKLKGDEQPRWGKFSAQGMIEHMTDSIGIGWNRIVYPMYTSPENLPKAKAFMLSDKPFKENTPNPYMGEKPPQLRNKNIAEAIEELEKEILNFVQYHKNNPGIIVQNPFFGDLNYEEWLHLLHKHALHHLRQFGLIE